MGFIFIFLGILSIFYSLFLFISHITFAGFFTIAGAGAIALGIFKVWLAHRKNNKKILLLSRLINIVVSIFLVSFIIIEALIVSYSFKRDISVSDYVIVLGAGVNGKNPSPMLRDRLDAAIKYLNINKNAKVILSGGRGPGENITEAEAMRKYMVKQGVSENKLIKEEKSTNTFENFKYSKEILKRNENLDKLKITVITNNFHMLRANIIAKGAGLRIKSYSVGIPNWLIPTYYIREYAGVIKAYIENIH